jgi:IS1 family transposase
MKRLERWDVWFFCTDKWKVYPQEIPESRLIQGKKGTVGIERNNGRQRHWFARFRRKSIVVSKSLHMVDLTMALFARFHVNGAIEDIQSFFC